MITHPIHNRVVHLVFTLLLMISVAQLSAQKPRLYSIEHGLASTQLTDLKVDNNNFLWVATRSGLSRFDGQNFTTFTADSDNPHKLNTNHISCSYIDDIGKIWIGANDGLYLLNHTTNSFEHFPLEKSENRVVSVTCIVNIEDRPGMMLVGTSGYGVYAFNRETLAVDSLLTQRYNDALTISYITGMINDDKGNHWVFTHHWLRILNPQTMRLITPVTTLSEEEQENCEIMSASVGPSSRTIYLGTNNQGLLMCHTRSFEIDRLDFPELKGRQLTSIAAGQDSCMLVGTEGQGFWSVNMRDRRVERLHFAQCPVDIDHVKIKSVAHDKQQNTWLNLYQKGLMVIPKSGKLFSCQPILANKDSEHNLSNVSCFSEASDKTRFYGLDGAGILMIRPDESRQLFNSENTIMKNNAIMALITLPNGDTYAGTYGDGIYKIDRNGKFSRDPHLAELDIRSIMCFSLSPDKQTLYIGSNGEGVFRYQLPTGELDNIILDDGTRWIVSLFADQDRLWAGTEGQVISYDYTTHEAHRYKELPSVRVFSIAKDKDGVVWFMADKGLFRYYKQGNSIHAIQVAQQMGETYSAMVISDDGKLWMASNHGITCYDPLHINAIRYNSPDISEVGSFSVRAAQRWADDTFSFGGDNGMVVFDPINIEQYDYKLAPIYFTRLWVNNKLTDYEPQLPASENVLDSALWTASTLRLPIESNSFSLSFTVQEYNTPVDINYAYRLNGYEETWHQVQGLNQTLSYSSLPAGTYTLVVSAHQGNDLNSQPQTKELTIIIYAPWYQRAWLRNTVLIFFGFTIIWMLYSMHNILSRRRKEKQSAAAKS